MLLYSIIIIHCVCVYVCIYVCVYINVCISIGEGGMMARLLCHETVTRDGERLWV